MINWQLKDLGESYHWPKRTLAVWKRNFDGSKFCMRLPEIALKRFPMIGNSGKHIKANFEAFRGVHEDDDKSLRKMYKISVLRKSLKTVNLSGY